MIPLQTQNSNIALFQTQNSNTYQHHGTKFSTSSSCFIIYQRPLFILHPLLFSSSQRLYSVQQDQTKETNKNYMIILTRLLGILKKADKGLIFLMLKWEKKNVKNERIKLFYFDVIDLIVNISINSYSLFKLQHWNTVECKGFKILLDLLDLPI